jgi:hypothetical protein
LPKHILFSLALCVAQATAQTAFPSLNSSPWLGQELLGRVSASSATINVVFDAGAQVYVEYGTTSGTYPERSSTQTAAAGVPLNITLTGLTANTRYYYRL